MVGNVCDQIPKFWSNFPCFFILYTKKKKEEEQAWAFSFFFVLNKKAFGEIKGGRKLALE